MDKDKEQRKVEKSTEEHHPHDKGYKKIFSVKKNFLDFIQKYVALDWMKNLTVDDIEVVNKEFVTDQFDTYESDIVYKIRVREWEQEAPGQTDHIDQYVYIFFLQEMQSSMDFTMPFRLLVYMTSIWMDYFRNTDKNRRKQKSFRLPPIIPLVLYNGAGSWTAERQFKNVVSFSDKLNGYVCNFAYILVDVSKLDVELIEKDNRLIDDILLADQLRVKKDWMENIVKISRRAMELSTEDQNAWKNWWEHVFSFLDEQTKEEFWRMFEKGEDRMCSGLEQAFLAERAEGRQ